MLKPEEEVLRRGFWYLNRYFMVPMFRAGLGPFMGTPFGGYIMVIKHAGRKTGLPRYSPVNYAILDGSVYCVAGFGHAADWYRNVRAQPRVDLIMPGGTVAGCAEEVADEGERLRAAREVLKNGGFAGFMLGFNPFTIPDERLHEAMHTIPVVRVRVNGMAGGPGDPGGWLWLISAAAIALPLLAWRARRKRA